MLTITLTRNRRQSNGVFGTMVLPLEQGEFVADTIENADFLIPAGKYPLRLTWSPRFKKLMPLIDEVPEREGIRIHMGTKPEHSTGCVLVNFRAMQIINSFIKVTQYLEEDEKAIIRIVSA